ncbi:MAG: hypothetical protein IGS39_22910 [Calothrix sp. C42_A2020_038]|nr:hypothetical protein [Calothrix sp. C42_A2020_038]
MRVVPGESQYCGASFLGVGAGAIKQPKTRCSKNLTQPKTNGANKFKWWRRP